MYCRLYIKQKAESIKHKAIVTEIAVSNLTHSLQ